MHSLLALRKMRRMAKARLRNVLLNVAGKYTSSRSTTFQELGAKAGDVIDWTARLCGGARLVESLAIMCSKIKVLLCWSSCIFFLLGWRGSLYVLTLSKNRASS